MQSNYQHAQRTRLIAMLFLLLPGGAIIVTAFSDYGSFIANLSSKIWLAVFIVTVTALWRFGHKLSAQ
jgi:hypothetical protein